MQQQSLLYYGDSKDTLKSPCEKEALARPTEETARYYKEALRNLNELLVLLKEDNVMLKEPIVSILRKDQTNLNLLALAQLVQQSSRKSALKKCLYMSVQVEPNFLPIKYPTRN